jgi:hypothetical protein
MDETVNQPPAHDRATADACADGQIEKVGHVLRGAPARFAEGRRVDVGVDPDRHAQRAGDLSRKVATLPFELGCRGDPTERRGFRGQVERPERPDADRPDRRVVEESDHAAQRLRGRGGVEGDRQKILRPGPHRANELRASRLNPAEPLHDGTFRPSVARTA